MRKGITLIVLVLIVASSAYAQEESWRYLQFQTRTLLQQGRYPEAIEVAEKALQIAKETFGTAHPYVAISLRDLAEISHRQGRYADAESLYIRALVTLKVTLEPGHPLVTTVLGNITALYREMSEAREMEKPFWKIREEHTRTLQQLRKLSERLSQLSAKNADVAYLLPDVERLGRTSFFPVKAYSTALLFKYVPEKRDVLYPEMYVLFHKRIVPTYSTISLEEFLMTMRKIEAENETLKNECILLLAYDVFSLRNKHFIDKEGQDVSAAHLMRNLFLGMVFEDSNIVPFALVQSFRVVSARENY